MDRFTEIMKYLLQEQGAGEFLPEGTKIRQAEQAFLLAQIEEILQENGMENSKKLEKIAEILREG